jgi:hypothetical protein
VDRKFIEESSGAEAEHSGIPEEISVLDVFSSALEGWFLHEPRDFEARAERCAAFDVAESGFGPVRPDAERHQVVLLRK